ncbi:uncharacterized protein [Haliotis cracherodii]|uniref:uncharacterized protein n=1 Tax=Haliotis cracherodii TaxID=6455 RepID=UPI0039ED21B5
MELTLLLLTAMFQHITGLSGHVITLSANPGQILIGGSYPTPQLTVNCSVKTLAASNITRLNEIMIGRVYGKRRDIQPIVTATNSSPVVHETGLQSRLTATGSFSATTGYLQIVLTQLECSSAFAYSCASRFELGPVNGNDQVTVNVSVINNPPKRLTISQVPESSLYYRDELVRFSCSGRIGNVFDKNVRNLWTWEWRSVGSVITPWRRYPNSTSIIYNPVRQVPASGGCEYSVGSTLTHRVSSLDIKRQFRCSVQGEFSTSASLSTEDSESSVAVKVAMYRDINIVVLFLAILLSYY